MHRHGEHDAEYEIRTISNQIEISRNGRPYELFIKNESNTHNQNQKLGRLSNTREIQDDGVTSIGFLRGSRSGSCIRFPKGEGEPNFI